MNAQQRAGKAVWELTTLMERLQEAYCVLNRPLPDAFGNFYAGLMAEIEYYDEELNNADPQ